MRIQAYLALCAYVFLCVLLKTVDGQDIAEGKFSSGQLQLISEGKVIEKERIIKDTGERSVTYSVSSGTASEQANVYHASDLYGYQHPTCDIYLWQGEGSLSSPNYPYEYRKNVRCSYRVPRVDLLSCALEVTFHDFHLDTDGLHCDSEYLEIGSRRFCGIQPGDKKAIIDFPYHQKEVQMTFKSNGIDQGRGFFIDVKRVYKSCPSPSAQYVTNLNVQTVKGRFTSNGYPDHYRPNTNCTYFIERQPGFCAVQISFLDFDIEYEPYSCSRDYMLFEGTRYCGTTLAGRNVTVSFRNADEVALIFVSDGNENANRGFDISYNQIPCVIPQPVISTYRPPPAPKFCDAEYSSVDIYLQSYNFPNKYESNMDCTYVIRRASVDVCELEFTFLKFDLEYDRLCRGDYVEINGDKVCGPLQDKTTRRIRFYGSEVVVKFHSDDSINHNGFQILVQQKKDCSESQPRVVPQIPYQYYCDEVKSTQEFYIQSLNLPHTSGVIDCCYTIRKFSSAVCELHLTFLSFQLNDDFHCEHQYLEVNGEKLCGASHQGTVRRILFDKPEVLVRFHSDGLFSDRNFQIFAQQRRNCEPSYRVIPIPTEPPLPPYCDAVFSTKEFRITSHNYPADYVNNMNCILRVQKYSADVCQLKIQVHNFDVEDVIGCRYDYLQINDQRLCGVIKKGTMRSLPFYTPEILMRFHTDENSCRPGYDITVLQSADCSPQIIPHSSTAVLVSPKYKSINTIPTQLVTYNLPSTSCDQVFTTWEFFIQSPHFPMNYGDNVDCTYIAQSYSPSVCAIELHFLSFDVEGDFSCTKDYLEVQGERFCGMISPGAIRRYRFTQPEFVLHFHSDHETSGLGYNILVRQITSCPAEDMASYVYTLPKKTILSSRLTAIPVGITAPVYNFQLSQPSSQFTSLNYPVNYEDNINCTYRIAYSKGACAVEFYFHDFDVQASPNCYADYLLLGGRRYCGSELLGQTRMVHFDHNDEITLNFVTDGAISRKGWWLFYRQIPCAEVRPQIVTPTLCHETFVDELGYIKTLAYPLALYSPNLDCYYRIQRQRNDICSVELTFSDFRLQPSTNCINDYLEINRKRYCGTDLQQKTMYVTFPVGSQEILMRFVTDGAREDKGFFCQARQVSYGCDLPVQKLPAVPASQLQHISTDRCNVAFRSRSGIIQSPNYPKQYVSNLDCAYTIVKSHPMICGVVLNFEHFALEDSRYCIYDYLQTPIGDRMCGRSWTGTSRSVAFPPQENTLVLVFHSDSQVENQGFHITYTQTETDCP